MAPELPRGVSSRLLTMKFMQRAAASTSSSGTPDPDAPSAKKRKLDQPPAPGRIDPNIDQALIQAALDEQEATRQAALEKHSAADTHWVLKMKINEPQSQKDLRPLNVVYVGYGDIDSDDNNEDSPAEGRTSTYPPKQEGVKAKERESYGSNKESSSSPKDDGDSDRKRKDRSSDSNSNSPDDRSCSQFRSRNNQESIRAKEFREKRRKKEIRFNNITSISSAGAGQFRAQDLKCYNCHQMGHKASDCFKMNARKKS